MYVFTDARLAGIVKEIGIMANTEILKAQARESFGKGASRQLRRAGRTPAVIYGHDSDPQHLSFDAHELYMLVRSNPNALLTIELDSEQQLALVKDVQRNPLSRIIEHVDLLRVDPNQKVEVEIPVLLEGEPFGAAVATVELMNVAVEVPALEIPESLTVNVEGKEDGTQITVADLDLPKDVTAVTDPEAIVVVIAIPQLEDLPEPGAEGEGAEAESAEAASEDAE
ncbi:MAG: 50S ribosomal protein L25/general stress protein Ctc [Actinomycetaceae bacterium]|nr:50S ribosomal protein L25/general stress protein Ctc [Arcanobacterium sp.]MDD7505601.1 50S ribosomal protein L25/general stress protein Ctc [Actinomycetaceae bacterium]MDY6143781.1 50S ribosomal protein L25/general stress protein Ctc [Arcanobacterium sp.]